jgi:alkylated DNA repair dioxygenase AlkB
VAATERKRDVSPDVDAPLPAALVRRRVHPELCSFYVPSFVDAAGVDFDALYAECNWRRPALRLFGRKVFTPRLVAFAGDPGVTYGYSGQQHVADGWSPTLLRWRDELVKSLAVPFNCVLGNCYRGGADSMGWHADDERELGARPVIASLSFGAPRRFLLRRRSDHARVEIVLESGSLFVMAGASQAEWQHCLPKTRAAVPPRINLTYRLVRVDGDHGA